MKLPLTGTCQCGQIHYRVSARPLFPVVCHCLDCQKLSAGAFSLTMALPRSGFEILRGDLKAWERPTASGNIAVCYFCPGCGNRIYHENPKMPEVVRLKPGTLDDAGVIRPEAHVWTKRAQAWVDLPADMPCFDTQPDIGDFVAKLSAGQSPFST